MSPREILSVSLFAVGSAVVFFFVPHAYRVSQDFGIVGNLDQLSRAPRRAVSMYRQLQDLSEEEIIDLKLRCGLLTSSNRLRCTLRAPTMGKAHRTQSGLTELAQTLGRIPSTTFDERMVRINQQVNQWHTQLQLAETNIAFLSEDAGQNQELADRARRDRDQIKTDLENRTRQQEMIMEALGDPERKHAREIFEKKHAEVKELITHLQIQLELAQGLLTDALAPLKDLKLAKQEYASLFKRIEVGQTELETMKEILTRTPNAAFLPDPRTIQLQRLEHEGSIQPLRSWATLVWALPLGIFLYGLVFKQEYTLRRFRPYQTAEEVEKETGLRLLARV